MTYFHCHDCVERAAERSTAPRYPFTSSRPIRYAPRSNGSNAPETIDDVIDDFRFVTSLPPSPPPPLPPALPPVREIFPKSVRSVSPEVGNFVLSLIKARAESVGSIRGGRDTARSSDWLPANRANSSRFTHAFHTQHARGFGGHVTIYSKQVALDSRDCRLEIFAQFSRDSRRRMFFHGEEPAVSSGGKRPRRLSILPRPDHWHD